MGESRERAMRPAKRADLRREDPRKINIKIRSSRLRTNRLVPTGRSAPKRVAMHAQERRRLTRGCNCRQFRRSESNEQGWRCRRRNATRPDHAGDAHSVLSLSPAAMALPVVNINVVYDSEKGRNNLRLLLSKAYVYSLDKIKQFLETFVDKDIARGFADLDLGDDEDQPRAKGLKYKDQLVRSRTNYA